MLLTEGSALDSVFVVLWGFSVVELGSPQDSPCTILEVLESEISLFLSVEAVEPLLLLESAATGA